MASNRKKALTKLSAYVHRVGGQVAAAKLLDCSNSYISKILSGDRNVDDVTLAVKIQRACDIPVEWWVNPR